MQNIRTVLAQDIPYLYSIALKTAFAGLDGTPYFNDTWCVGHYYAAPYFFFEPELCYVALDENGTPSGYIVGTSDTASLSSWLLETWLPPLQKHYKHHQAFKSEAEETVIRTLLKGPGQSGISSTSPYQPTTSLTRQGVGAKPDGNLHSSGTRERCPRHPSWCGRPEHPCLRLL